MNVNLENQVDTKIIDEIITKHKGKPGELLTVMEEVQEANDYKYLDEASMGYISSKSKVPLSQIYSVATFYSFFNTFFMTQGARNWPFLILTTRPVFAAS